MAAGAIGLGGRSSDERHADVVAVAWRLDCGGRRRGRPARADSRRGAGIDEHADGIWTVGKQIAGNTVSIWMLEQANSELAKTLEVAGNIERVATSIDTRLATLAGGSNG